jgi:hypothetical protein
MCKVGIETPAQDIIVCANTVIRSFIDQERAARCA